MSNWGTRISSVLHNLHLQSPFNSLLYYRRI